MKSWELFSPLRPQLSVGDVRPLGVDQGLTVSIPYSFLAGNQLDIGKLVSRLRAEHTPPHLREWVRVRKRKAAGSTKRSFHKAFWLYEVLVLYLLKRYPGQLAGKTVQLDKLVANFLADPRVAAKAARHRVGVNAEQTRQQRIALLRTLRSAAPDFFPWLT